MIKFHNRREAGKALAMALVDHKVSNDAIVLALPRGGVPVAYEIAVALHLPLDLLIVRKLGVPSQEELAFGAVTHGGMTGLNQHIIKEFDLSPEDRQKVIEKETIELERRERVYRGNRPFPDLTGKTVILVDDGVATGASIRVAIVALRAMHVGKMIVAIPVAANEICGILAGEVDELVCLLRPENFRAVGNWYEDFAQTEDEEVHELLRLVKHFP